MDEISSYKGIPAMTSPEVHAYLKELGRGWKGKGVATELGCWLGGSAAPLLEGLVEAGYNRPFYAYDRWIANEEQCAKAKTKGQYLFPNQRTKAIFDMNMGVIYDKVISVQGDLPDMLRVNAGDKIEICIFDAPKTEPVFSGCMNKLQPYFIPGVTVLGLLDYKFYERHTDTKKRNKFLAPVKYMEAHRSAWELLKEWKEHCPVFFKYRGA